MLSLGVDTSNYATSLAVVDTTKGEVVCALKRFLPVPKGEKGLRQSDAVFHHTRALPELLAQLGNSVALTVVEAVGASTRPRSAEGSYMPCFLAGAGFAAAFGAGRGLAPVACSHQQGHLAAALFGAGSPALAGGEFLFFHLSGGTTELLLARDCTVQSALGKSMDLFAGQAVDRLGVLLGAEFPAGPALSDLAEKCDEPVDPPVSVKGTNCHLSGLENQCARLLEEGRPPAYVAKYCLTAVAKTVVRMAAAARGQAGALPLLCAGGVMCSTTVRPYIERHCDDVWFAPPELSSDSAVGPALIAAKEAEHA